MGYNNNCGIILKFLNILNNNNILYLSLFIRQVYTSFEERIYAVTRLIQYLSRTGNAANNTKRVYFYSLNIFHSPIG